MATLCGWQGVERVLQLTILYAMRFIRFYADLLQTLQLTLRPFDEGCREPEGADSFLCKEFGRKFWRQRVAFD